MNKHIAPLQRPKVDVITMGCSKNLVDSERLLRMFDNYGFEARHNPENVDSEIVVINTCGFIADAKIESIDMIIKCGMSKQKGMIRKLYVMGCLSQRHKDELIPEIPEVDGWYGKFDWESLASDLAEKYVDNSSKPWERRLTTPPYSAYIKVSEGCNRKCAFCAIPLITGPHKSRPFEEIVAEVKMLASQGVKEFNVIAQDLSSYGLDIYHRQRIAELIDAISDVPGVAWVRLHYLYPAQFPMDLLDVMARKPNVCRYLDIALQHGSNKVLSNMRRHITKEETEKLLSEIRRRVPGIHIRTTLMVGFHGEGEKEFEELKDFVKEQRFDRMGAFAYCKEEDTYAYVNYPGDIPDDVKERRLEEIMALQEEIALEGNLAKVGNVLKVLVERETPDYYVGRTEWDSPEVDPEVLIIKSRKAEAGEFVKVRIKEALPFELIGEFV